MAAFHNAQPADGRKEAGTAASVPAGISRPAPAQALAIEHAFGAIQVLAGPGSGKTYLTIRRIRHLICHHGISPEKILVITFTKAAAAEMEERFYKLTEGLYKGVRFGTFHAVYFHILKKSSGDGQRLAFAAIPEKYGCLEHVLRMHGIQNAGKELSGALLKAISNRKNSVSGDFLGSGMECPEAEKLRQLFPAVFREYCGLMEEMGKLDFDDMVFLCDRMLTEQKEILKYWQNAFSHILVDEFQDISPLQYRVLRKLAAPRNNLFVVGDDDQSIYGFRGAGPDIMKQFLLDYPDAVQLTLDTNYRSACHIVGASLLLISDNRNRFEKQIRAHSRENGSVTLHAFREKEEEELFLLRALQDMPPEELEYAAIICRTNAQLAGLSRPLAREGIPFCCKDRVENIFNQEMAKDFAAYLRFARDACGNRGQKGGKREDFLRIMNRPCRYISRCAVDGGDCSEQALLDYYSQKPYMQHCVKQFYSGLRRISSLRPFLAVDYVRKTMGYDVYLLEGKGAQERQKLLETAEEIQKSAVPCRILKEWTDYMDAYAKRLEENNSEKKTEGKGICLVTMHGSKGLEYGTVFLPQVNARQIPSRKAHSAEALEEERRIFYVAMTRAKRRLELSYAGAPSPFLTEWVNSGYVDKRG